MTDVVARLEARGKNFEILIDLDKALAFKKRDEGRIEDILAIFSIFSDHRKGLHVSEADLKEAFKTTDTKEIAKRIIKEGQIQLPAEYKKAEKEAKTKQVIDFLSRSCIDPRTGKPHTPERISSALKEAACKIDNRKVEEQAGEIIKKLQPILPMHIETKKIKINVPSIYTGQVYGLLQQYKEKEEWLSDGSLICTLNIPATLEIDFYDKLNKITHGSAVTEEIKER